MSVWQFGSGVHVDSQQGNNIWRSIFGCISVLLFVLVTLSAQAEDSAYVLKQVETRLPGILDTIRDRNELLSTYFNKDGMTFGGYGVDSQAQQNKDLANAETVHHDAYPGGVRDPFSSTPDMMSQMAGVQKQYVSGFKIATLEQQIPKLKLRGIVVPKHSNSPLALLDVGVDGVHMVRIGDEISFNPADPKQVLKIQKISRSNVVVEVGTLGDLIVVR